MAEQGSERAFAAMNEEELNAELDAALDERERTGGRPQRMGQLASRLDHTIPISIRVPSRLLDSLKKEAGRRRMPYQRLMLQLIEKSLDLESRAARTVTVPVDAELLRAGRLVIELDPRR